MCTLQRLEIVLQTRNRVYFTYSFMACSFFTTYLFCKHINTFTQFLHSRTGYHSVKAGTQPSIFISCEIFWNVRRCG